MVVWVPAHFRLGGRGSAASASGAGMTPGETPVTSNRRACSQRKRPPVDRRDAAEPQCVVAGDAACGKDRASTMHEQKARSLEVRFTFLREV
jgi:hypothetical protein